ncbi:unnamed protein product [Adineta ricciae]|uniref:Uncharacterized protein n=1 Tax=Adineta ricciae TaxID=249248 RepID=A0A815VTK8_ADIRI|nr:unnamed protein product [Adineta ricciae]
MLRNAFASRNQLNMYNTDQPIATDDSHCLLYYVPEDLVSYAEAPVLSHQIIPYCLRSSIHINTSSQSKHHRHFTFGDLRKQNVSSEQLYTWLAPIDLIETYQQYLNNETNASDILFFNCSWPWLGPICQFTFDPKSLYYSLDDIMRDDFQVKRELAQNKSFTCYTHLNCSRPAWSPCLDWREICDGKIDCLDSSEDEANCIELELNECDHMNQYRCHNGACIPADFVHDDMLNPDCIDGTDEPVSLNYPHFCYSDPTIRCEERSCRPGSSEHICGDGYCVKEAMACKNAHGDLMTKIVLSNDLQFETCWSAMFKLLSMDTSWYDINTDLYGDNDVSIEDICPSLFEFPPNMPVIFGHVRFLFENKQPVSEIPLPAYICYNAQLCDFLPTSFTINGSTCISFSQLDVNETEVDEFRTLVDLIQSVKEIFRGCSNNNITFHSSLYQCENSSKFISYHRLVDGIHDCPYNDDEQFAGSCSLDDRYRFKCQDEERCVTTSLVRDRTPNCNHGNDEYDPFIQSVEKHILFQTICDGIQELTPIEIDGRNETDETECEEWPCNNTNTRCDGFWTCADGADEVNCYPSPCPPLHHMCVSPLTFKLGCLPIDKVNNFHVDCVGGSDERHICRSMKPHSKTDRFYCMNDTKCLPKGYLCDTMEDCIRGDDEKFCTNFGGWRERICNREYMVGRTEEENFLCGLDDSKKPSISYLSLLNSVPYPSSTSNSAHKSRSKRIASSYPENRQQLPFEENKEWRCNRGLQVRTSTENKYVCLCPPSYYGDRCEYQNQRVSLTLQIRTVSSWRTVFSFVVTLIDNDQEDINSHDHLEYLPIRDCSVKFHIYLLYATRPRNSSKNYSVRIDGFTKNPLQYHATWKLLIPFQFLPVHRLAAQLLIPIEKVEAVSVCPISCLHGSCIKYINTDGFFCRCNDGWSGAQCSKEQLYNNCAPGAISERSICVCPLGKVGPRCYLTDTACDSNPCANDGYCVSTDLRLATRNTFTCVCLEGYYGDRCEHTAGQIIIAFQDLAVPANIFLHLITVHVKANYSRFSMLKKIPFEQEIVTFHTNQPFHIGFVQYNENYYIAIVQEIYNSSVPLSTTIAPSQRCIPIEELFNKSFVQTHLLRRIKSYHVPCKTKSGVACFFDDIHMCLCNGMEQANCFEFNHNTVYDCRGYNYCENGGHCFQDNITCPTSSVCVCEDCFYGSRCQFSTRGFDLSLDAILGYQIRPKIAIINQSNAVKFSIAVSIGMFAIGIINGFLSLLTFRGEKPQEVGCGIYLFYASITSICAVCVLMIKIWLLLLSQMGAMMNPTFLMIQCISVDFIVRNALYIGDWLNASVAVERAISVLKNTTYDKRKSRQMSKWIILLITIFTSSTTIHDPIHRKLIHDKEEERTWCIVRYSPSFQAYNLTTITFHFFAPFALNIVSALIIIIVTTRQRASAQREHTYKQHLSKQLNQHKNLVYSPSILIVLALPRIITSFVPSCMNSARDPWIFLNGYFISFIPPTLIFAVFVLPSNLYKAEFNNAIAKIWKQLWILTRVNDVRCNITS